MKASSLQKTTAAALLIALGTVIPVFSPLKIILEPASFTLASHIAIFISIFISPAVALSVTLGTALGFFLGGFPLVIVLRASSHLFFAWAGAWFVAKKPELSQKPAKMQLFSFSLALIHALGEVLVVSIFYFGGQVTEVYYAQGFLTSVFLLVGLGTIIHSMFDFSLALIVLRIISRQSSSQALFSSTFAKIKDKPLEE